MGLFRRKPDNAEQMEKVVSDLRSFKERLDQADAEKATLQHQVDVLRSDNARLTEKLTTPPPAEPPPPLTPPIDPRVDRIEDRMREIDRLHQQLHSLSAVVARSAEETAAIKSAQLKESDTVGTDAIRTELAQVAEKMSSLDARVTQVSTELANQVTELGHELDARDVHPDGAAESGPTEEEIISRITELVETHVDERVEARVDERVDVQLDDRVDAAVDDAFGDLATGQERLAGEQARFEIQFRKDLAELADRLRRPGPRGV
jgi:chromosome segregation ATPase